jgi:hypothetical protein
MILTGVRIEKQKIDFLLSRCMLTIKLWWTLVIAVVVLVMWVVAQVTTELVLLMTLVSVKKVCGACGASIVVLVIVLMVSGKGNVVLVKAVVTHR